MNGYILHQTFTRPKTRGELRDRINAGEICEVAALTEEFTSLMLRSWLNANSFTTCLSPNEGWVLYCPDAKKDDLEVKP